MNEARSMNHTRGHSLILPSLQSLCGLCLGFVLAMAPIPGSAQDAPGERNPSPRRGPNGFGQFAPNRPMIQRDSIKLGYLFVDGEYLAMPYEVEIGNGEMQVNGV